MIIFISHIHEEAPLADLLQDVLQSAISSCEAFVSSRDLGAGEQWLLEVDKALQRSQVVLVLCSPDSIRRPWVNFEAGRGWQPDRRVIPVCHSGMERDKLPHPLSIFQGVQLYNPSDLQNLVAKIAGATVVAGVAERWPDVERALRSLDYTAPAKVPLPQPQDATRSILVDHAHGQAKWNTTQYSSLFELPEVGVREFLPDVEETGEWNFQPVTDQDQLRAADMKTWRGMILGTPWERQLSPKTIEQIVQWVWSGGRLALLGFELGDLHHKANLNDLAIKFGLQFHADIVAPRDWKSEQGKPYGHVVKLGRSALREHPLTAGIESLEWYNLQSLSYVPGGNSLVCIDDNLLGTPKAESVIFPDRQLRLLKDNFDFFEGGADACVAAFAPDGLTTPGAVVGIGTWQLLQPNNGNLSIDSQRFMMNLMRWLTDS